MRNFEYGFDYSGNGEELTSPSALRKVRTQMPKDIAFFRRWCLTRSGTHDFLHREDAGNRGETFGRGGMGIGWWMDSL